MDHLTPSAAAMGRRSRMSDYHTAGEEEDSDNSLYYSFVETDNKENSVRESAKKPKAGTPLHKKLLEKGLKTSALTPRNKHNKRVSFNVGGGSFSVTEQVAKMHIAHHPTVEEAEPTAQLESTIEDDHDTTVVPANPQEPPAEAPPEPATSSAMPVLQVAQATAAEDVKQQLMKKIRLSQKRMSTARPINKNSASATQRKKLASEMGRKSTAKRRSTLCQDRRTSVRRSVEALKRNRVNKRENGELKRIHVRITVH